MFISLLNLYSRCIRISASEDPAASVPACHDDYEAADHCGPYESGHVVCLHEGYDVRVVSYGCMLGETYLCPPAPPLSSQSSATWIFSRCTTCTAVLADKAHDGNERDTIDDSILRSNNSQKINSPKCDQYAHQGKYNAKARHRILRSLLECPLMLYRNAIIDFISPFYIYRPVI